MPRKPKAVNEQEPVTTGEIAAAQAENQPQDPSGLSPLIFYNPEVDIFERPGQRAAEAIITTPGEVRTTAKAADVFSEVSVARKGSPQPGFALIGARKAEREVIAIPLSKKEPGALPLTWTDYNSSVRFRITGVLHKIGIQMPAEAEWVAKVSRRDDDPQAGICVVIKLPTERQEAGRKTRKKQKRSEGKQATAQEKAQAKDQAREQAKEASGQKPS